MALGNLRIERRSYSRINLTLSRKSDLMADMLSWYSQKDLAISTPTILQWQCIGFNSRFVFKRCSCPFSAQTVTVISNTALCTCTQMMDYFLRIYRLQSFGE